MTFWGRSSPSNDISARIEDLQSRLNALGGYLEDQAETAGHHALRRSRSAASDLASFGSSAADTVRGQLDDLTGVVQGLTASLARGARKQSSQAYGAVEERLEDHAVAAVVAALGVGFLLGALVSRNR
jgi:ElaB/YqjD/DUF883 family membrane-anchored ribosome-binding protein